MTEQPQKPASNTTNTAAGKPTSGGLIGAELSPQERREVLEDLFVFGKKNQRPFLNRMGILLTLSTIIACCGLLANSAAVVIGAMLIAPMMRPVMSAAGAIVMGWSARLYESLLLALVMAVAAVVISMGVTLLAPDMVEIPTQVMERTKPTFFDLVIALAAGASGAYIMTRKESSAVPGVAMAVSLLPPLSSSGILLVFGEPDLALRAFVLFTTNLFAMVLSGTLVFIMTGVSPAKKRQQSAKFVRTNLIIFALLIAGISVPLYFYSNTTWFDDTYEAARSEALQSWLAENNLRLIKTTIDRETAEINLMLSGPRAPLSLEDLYFDLKADLQDRTFAERFKINVQWTRSVHSSWPPPATGELEAQQMVDSALAKLALLRGQTWRWQRTSYIGELWSDNDGLDTYTVIFLDDNVLRITSNCHERDAKYTISQGSLTVLIDTLTPQSCDGHVLDQLYVNDLKRIVDFQVSHRSLILELGSGAGAMFFRPVLSLDD
ncbi:MAG: putative hydrophobic protein (TIGR00271 family) [Halioglobus sp.]|jgi:uncharacterized hydrophobic protein (TIGR00271 family)